MADYDAIFKNIIGVYERSLRRVEPATKEWLKRTEEIEALNDTLNELKYLRSITKPVPKTLGDLSDIPEELKAELSAIKTDDVENQIFTIINSCESKEANIDTILVELFRRFDAVHKRTYITNKLWRMVNKSEVLWNGQGGKGYYTSIEPKESLNDQTDNFARENFDLDPDIPF